VKRTIYETLQGTTFSIIPPFPPLGSKYSPQLPGLEHNQCSSLSLAHQVSQPYKTTDKINFFII